MANLPSLSYAGGKIEAPGMAETFHARFAVEADMPALSELMAAAIAVNLKPFLAPELIASSHAIMGLDTSLIADRTYWIVYGGDEVAGCGGWSRRATLYGGDHSAGRNAALLDPAVDAARVRAMYTHPAWVRRGVGSLILRLCEDAAAGEGFSRLELMATLSGEPLYRAHGFVELERLEDGGVPLVRMAKTISPIQPPQARCASR
jgi:GNAT superfamily N-acetyltransferase